MVRETQLNFDVFFTLQSSGLGQSDDEYIKFDDIAEDDKSALRSALQQSGFARTSLGGSNIEFLPCPAGTFVNSSAKGYPSCTMCPPGKNH